MTGANALPEIVCTSQAGDLGKEMAGSQDVGEFASCWKEIPVLAGEDVPETGTQLRRRATSSWWRDSTS